jgi:hypothetical protein
MLAGTSLLRCRYLYTLFENRLVQKTLHFFEDPRILERKAKQRGSFDMKDGKLGGPRVPEKPGAGAAAVFLPENNSARF